MCETCISQNLTTCYLPESSYEVVSIKCAMLSVCFHYNPPNFIKASQAFLTVEDPLPCIFKNILTTILLTLMIFIQMLTKIVYVILGLLFI